MKNIKFTLLDYKHLQSCILSGTINDGNDNCGEITLDAVCCELIIREGADNAPFSYGKGHIALDANLYLLGKDTGYGEVNGVPYSYMGGFYTPVEDTYVATLKNLLNRIDEFIETNEELKEGEHNNKLTWEKVRKTSMWNT